MLLPAGRRYCGEAGNAACFAVGISHHQTWQGDRMKRPSISQRIPGRIEVGEEVSFTRTITEADVALFIGVTWDVNPLHTDDTHVRETPLRRRIVPGLLTASLLTHLGGLWAFMATEMRLRFLAPVFIGDSITAKAVIREVDLERAWVRLACECTNEEGEVVLTADVDGYPGRWDRQAASSHE
jgi:3-hydroxybutyryl-CoA dehydratase